MKSIVSGIIATIIAILCLGSLAAAKKREYPEPPPYVNPVEGEFPLCATYIYYKDAPVTRQDLLRIKECGFNIMRASAHEPRFKQTLDSLEGIDLKTVSYIWEALGTDTERVVNRFKDNPHIVLYHIYDEPNTSQYPDVKKLCDRFNSIDSTRMTFVNLLAKTDPKQLQAPDYATYVDAFVQTVNPPFLSFDIYPVWSSRNKAYVAEDGLYSSYGTISRISRESKRPFWAYILTTKHWNYPKPKTEYIRFQVFVALGYGAQGLSFFTYALPDFDRKDHKFSDSALDEEGNPTDVWYMIRDVNREVTNLKDVFLGAEVVDVSHTGSKLPPDTKRLGTPPAPFNSIESGKQGIMVSHLRNGDNEYLLLLNRSVTEKQKVHYSLSAPVTRLTGDGKEKREKGSSVTLSPGGYALYRL